MYISGTIFTYGCGDVATISDQAALTSANYKPVDFSGDTLLSVTVNLPYKEILKTVGGLPPLTFKLTKGILPVGLTMDTASGIISGTVADSEVNKEFSFTVSVLDSNGVSDEQIYSIKVSPYTFVVTPVDLPLLVTNQPYQVTLLGIGAIKPVKWQIVGDAPAGTALDPNTGILTIDSAAITLAKGTDLVKDGLKLTVKSSDKNGVEVTKPYIISVAETGYLAPSLLDKELLNVATDVAYKEVIPIKGGAAPLTFKLIKGDLPKGIILDETSGVLSGKVLSTSLGNKQSVFNIQVTDAYGKTDEKVYTLSIVPYTLTVVPQELPQITPMIPFAIKLGAIGGVKPITFSIVGDLPARLKLAADGTLSTTAPYLALSTANSEWPVDITATDAQGVVGKSKLTIKVGASPANSSPLALQNTTLATMVAGAEYNAGVIATGGVAPLKFQIISGSLPLGLSLDAATGMITGTLGITAGNSLYAAIIKVTDAIGETLSQSYSGTVTMGSSPLSITTTSMPSPSAGSNYAAVVSVTGGKTPYNFTITSGTLPSGLSLNSSAGTITGIPTYATAGTAFVFTITVMDATNQTASKPFSGTIGSSSASLAIQTPSIVAPTAGNAYLQLIAATGGLPPYTFAISSGSLPSGLAINSSSGMISGTVAYSARNNPYLFSVMVSDSNANSAVQAYTGFVGNYTISLLPSSLTTATPGAYYTSTVITAGGQAPYVYSLTSGTLPTGLGFNTTTGEISGTVADAEAGLTKTFTITTTDTNGATTNRAYSLATASFAITLSTGSLAAATEGQAYSNGGQNLTASGGTTPYTYEYSGNLPSGIGLTSAGVFFGTPAYGQGALAGGTNYTIQIRVRDAQNRVSQANSKTINVGVSLPVVGSDTPNVGVLGTAYSYTLSSTGGRPTYTYSLVSGSLPTGLSLSTAGVISGTPTAATACPAGQFTVRSTDSLAQNSANSVKCIATVTGVNITNTSFPTVVTGVNYSGTVTTIGGTTPYSYSSSGLPTGVSLNSTTGALSGFVNAATGDYTVYLTATDSSSPTLSTTQVFVFKVRDPLSITTTTVNRAGSGIAYSPVTLVATGGETPYTFSINSGALPSGLSLSSSGIISGTPAANSSAGNGTYTFSVIVRDSAGLTSAVQSYTLYVTRGPKITTRRMPTAVVGRAFAYDIEFTGGVNQFISTANLASRLTWGATGLPSGLSINAATGRISGTPAGGSETSSPYTVTLSLSDQHGITATKSVPMEIRTAGLTFDADLPRMNEPCPTSSIANCETIAHAVGALVSGTPNTKYMVYGALTAGTTAAPTTSVIYIARIDSQGQVATPGTSNLTVTYTPSSVGWITGLDLGDIDNDGFTDIVYSDRSNNKIVVVWNDGTTDANGMPVFSSQNTFNMPASGARPMMVKVRQLRPDTTNSNKKDLIVADYDLLTPATAARLVVFLAQNSCSTNCSGSRSTVYTGTGASITAYNTTLITPAVGLGYIGGLDIGYFNTAPGTGVCPSIAITGRRISGANTDHIFLRHQAYASSVCNGNFGTHATSDEGLVSSNNNIPSHPAIADFNNDGISDIAVVLRWTTIANSAAVKVFMMPGGNVFPGAALTPLLPYTTGTTYVGGSVVPYCTDGSTTCSFPGLLVAGGRDRGMVITAGTATSHGFLSFIPNYGASPWFEDNTGNNRIDYEGLPGIGVNGLTATPIVTSNKNDIAFMGVDNNAYPYYFMAPRNGSSTTDPLKLKRMALSVPTYLANSASVGTIKLLDVNQDGNLDLISHLVNASAISITSGNLTTNVPGSIPEPTSNPIGSNFGLPNTYHYQSSMDSGDFNEDGYPDFATVGNASRVVTVNFGDGTTTVGNSVMLEPGISGDLYPRVINVKDYDNDGHDDIIIYNLNNTTNQYSMGYFKGNGNGTFAAAQEFNLANAVCGDVRTMVSKDLNGDGRPEIAILCAGNQALWILRRHADVGGTWVKNSGGTVNSVTAGTGTSLAIGFLTSTTGYDVVLGGADTANSYRIINGLQLSTPDTNGNFNVTVTTFNPYQAIRGNLSSAEITDLDNDGYGDLILTPATQASSGATSVISNLFYTCHTTSAGNCTRRPWGGYGAGMTGIAVGDINNDGRNDFILGTRTGDRLYYRMILRAINTGQ